MRKVTQKPLLVQRTALESVYKALHKIASLTCDEGCNYIASPCAQITDEMKT